jgi:hypothetical protein
MALRLYVYNDSTGKLQPTTIATTNVLLADGTVGLSATWNAGAHQIQVGVDPSAANDLTRKSWVESQIAAVTIPDATAASGGGVKGKVTFDSDKGISVVSGVASLNIDTALLGFSAGALYVKESTISHSALANLNTASYTHLSATNATDLTDAGDTTLHYHAADRDRANHTGTQTASTISDFTEAAQDATAAAIAAGTLTGISITYTDASNKFDFTVNTDGVTTQVNGSNQVIVKAGGISDTELAGNISLSKLAALTANRALVSNASGVITVSTVSDTEIGYLSGVTSSIQTQLSDKVSKTVETTMAAAINMNNFKIKNLGYPTLNTDAASKAYVDANAVNQDFQQDVIDLQIDNTLDPGASPVDGDRYIITNSGSIHANFGTINKYMDGSPATLGDDDIVEYVLANSEFRIAFDASAHTSGGVLVWVINESSFYNYTPAGSWGPFGGLAGVTAGIGLEKVGNVLNVKLGAGIVELPSDEVGIDIATNGGLELTSVLTGGQLKAKVDDTTIALDASGIKIKDGGVGTTQLGATVVTAAKLGADVAGLGLQGGNGSAIAVKPDVTGGANLAEVINVTSNGVAVKIDDSTLGVNGSSQLYVVTSAINHDSLGGLNSGEYRHLTSTQYTDLTDAGDSTLHYHAADRDRANHTGTQASTTISDFTEAAQDATNSMIAAGTHSAITFTYNDAGNSLSSAVQVDDETIKIIGNQLVAVGSPVVLREFTNNTGGTLAAGALVSISITVADECVAADSTHATYAEAVGVVQTDITNGNTGYVIIGGEATVLTDGTNLDIGKWVYVAGGANAGKASKSFTQTYLMKLGRATATNKVLIEKQWIG